MIPFRFHLQPTHLTFKQTRCPASFEVLDGSFVTSADDIRLFLQRVLAFPDWVFTIIAVDRLSSNEQDIIANFLAKHSRSEDRLHLHCVQLRNTTTLHAPPGVDTKLWDNLSLDDDNLTELWIRENVLRGRNVKNLLLVHGPSSSGKTRYIREEMTRLAETSGAEVASVYIHEDFCLSSAVASLRSKFKRGSSQDRAIHIVIPMAADGNQLLCANSFFNSFLILQHIQDPSSGSCFYSGNHQYHVFVELDCAGNESDCLAWLKSCIPILTCCSAVMQPPPDYIVDDRTRRVCTYLRAYDNGTIDRKFDPTPCNKQVFFVLDKSGSMQADLGGRTALEVAADSMVDIFGSHVQLMDVSAGASQKAIQ